MITPQGIPADDEIGRDTGLRSSRPPPRFTLVRRWVVRTVAQLHGVREGVREEISSRAHHGPDHVARDMVLVASELVTNAIHHGRTTAVVRLLQDGARFLITVSDRGSGTAPRFAGLRPVGDGGFGLRIVQRLAHDLGWYRTATGKVIWAEVCP